MEQVLHCNKLWIIGFGFEERYFFLFNVIGASDHWPRPGSNGCIYSLPGLEIIVLLKFGGFARGRFLSIP